MPYRYVLFRRVDAALNSTSQQQADYYRASTAPVIFASKPLLLESDNPECKVGPCFDARGHFVWSLGGQLVHAIMLGLC